MTNPQATLAITGALGPMLRQVEWRDPTNPTPWQPRPTELLVLAAQARLAVTECPPASNAGPAVEAFQAATGNKAGDAWCASFVVDCFDRAIGRPLLPIKRSGSVQQIVDAAKAKGGMVESSPAFGDLICLFYPSLSPARYGHIGIVTGPPVDGRVPVISGNTSGGGSREGWGVFAHAWPVDNPTTLFLRWWRP